MPVYGSVLENQNTPAAALQDPSAPIYGLIPGIPDTSGMVLEPAAGVYFPSWTFLQNLSRQSQAVALGFIAGVNEWLEVSLGSTPEQIKIGSATLYLIELDNTVPGGTIEYFKLWFVPVGSVVLGTTPPDMVIPIPALTKIDVLIVPGTLFSTATGITVACVTTGGTAGVTAPGTAVAARVAYA